MLAPYIRELLTSLYAYNDIDDDVMTGVSPHSIPDKAIHSVSNTAVSFTSITLHHIRWNGTELSDVTLNRLPTPAVLHRIALLWNLIQWNITVSFSVTISISPILIAPWCYLLPLLDSFGFPKTFIIGFDVITVTACRYIFLTTTLLKRSL